MAVAGGQRGSGVAGNASADRGVLVLRERDVGSARSQQPSARLEVAARHGHGVPIARPFHVLGTALHARAGLSAADQDCFIIGYCRFHS